MEPTHSASELENRFAEAVALHQRGNIQEATQIYMTILEKIPDSPLVNYNLGLALYADYDFIKSSHYFKKTLDQAPDNVDALYNFGLSLSKSGNFEQAITAYNRLLAIEPNDIDALYNIGCAFKDIDNDEKALQYYQRVVQLNPNHQAALNNMAYIYHKADNFTKAKEYYTLLLNINPEHQSAKHMLLSLKGDTPEVASPHYVKEVFDAYSTTYDSSLVDKLHYTVPQAMRSRFEELCHITDREFDTLDLGCGTGLGGEAFQDISRTLEGVDISPRMVEIARQKNIYSALHVSEINSYLNNCTKLYNLVVATDVFTYIGKLDEILMAIYNVLAQDAFLCFSTEHGERENYSLRTSGRFAHAHDYILSLGKSSGFTQIESFPTQLRKEKEKWIEGRLYFLRK